MSTTKFDTNETIGVLTKAIMLMEEREITFYDHLAGNVDVAFLKERIVECIGIVAENSELLAKICEAKRADELRFLDEKPFRIAILRLNAAVLQAQSVCGETVATSD